VFQITSTRKQEEVPLQQECNYALKLIRRNHPAPNFKTQSPLPNVSEFHNRLTITLELRQSGSEEINPKIYVIAPDNNSSNPKSPRSKPTSPREMVNVRHTPYTQAGTYYPEFTTYIQSSFKQKTFYSQHRIRQ
jgi:hypothetical protein